MLAFLLLGFALGWLVDLQYLATAFVVYTFFNLMLTLVGPTKYFDFSFGLFGNPNALGIALALAIASGLAYCSTQAWILLPVYIAGLAYCQSRTALIGAAGALLIWLWSRSKALVLLTIIAAVGSFYLEWHGGSSMAQRVGIWQSTLMNLTWHGGGLGSFYHDFWLFPIHINATLVHANHAYNDFLELIFDLGLGTIPLWIFLAGVVSEADRHEALILLTYAITALAFFPLFIFPIGTFVAGVLGTCLRRHLCKTKFTLYKPA